ncbi:bromodomain-containing protein 7-like [Saccoglossus kowalevskii]|uniref:Bromodomain-containing protein 7-like n=1 Tax=Saccoglossus kowalevskii TaxID=10224 RepID=A0ABM0MYP6_SACKO|nr:PREDICTED: bromodomain-containing protein 7-like [Saccoglossus kowalevskii]
MGKKHKKHHKSEKRCYEEKPLKLVLRVGNPSQEVVDFADEKFTEEPIYNKEHHHKSSKKKKKKKSHEKHEKHRHHEKRDKSSKKREREIEDVGFGHIDRIASPPRKKPFISPLPERRFLPNRLCREKEKEPETTPLKKILEVIHRQLQRKDPNQFFAWPVTDIIAPGYSSIVQHAMDFSTMQQRLDNDEYHSIESYKADMKLMCDNAMLYNRPETIYYKVAKKLLNYGLKIMSKERIIPLKRAMGFEIDDDDHPITTSIKIKRPKREEPSTDDSAMDIDIVENEEVPILHQEPEDQNSAIEKVFEPLENMDEDDGLTPEEIVDKVTQAAQHAKEKLSRRCPNSKIGFLRRQKDGTTTLAVVNPECGVESGGEVHPVNLGLLVGKLTAGSSSIAGFREDKRNKVNPVSYLMYGPFGSYAPTYDSSFATISKEDSDLLFSTYGDQTGIQYAASLQSFVKDTGDYSVTLANGLLDNLTNGEHSKTLKKLKEKEEEELKKLKEDEKKTTEDKENDDRVANETETVADKQVERVAVKEEPSEKSSELCQELNTENTIKQEHAMEPLPEIDFEALKSLSDIGIDMSFLPSMEKDLSTEKEELVMPSEKCVQEKLNETSDLIQDLEKSQHERLSKKPPSNLQYISGPSDKECEIAERLAQQLKELTAQAGPGGVVSSQSVRTAMGVTIPDTVAATPPTTTTTTTTSTPGNNEIDLIPDLSPPSHMSAEEEAEIDRELREFLESPSIATDDPKT